ncbi:lysine biosynthesis protein LysW [Candidatus Bathyarchaeota archaeon]|nr:MAG: lysine biosynthesis protein LysW [Candidatus Hecatellales archaeon]RLI34465.1 MAG: lysine biosynthesis protein LysW [Candidatus Bathyarchaeota archaeon]
MAKKVKCTECDAEFEVPDDVVVGEVISCPDCGLELEVVEIEGDTVKVKILQVSGEDWGE